MPLKIVFFGTPDFAVPSLNAIYEAGYDVRAVVTMPDKPAGRGHKLLQSPIKKWALEHDVKVLQPENLKSDRFVNELRALDANLFIVIAFRMLPEIVWSMPALGTFNLHASLLPDYRGAAPINHALINGDKKTGVTTFFLKHEIDTGDIILQESIDIDKDDDAGTLHDKLMRLGEKVTLATVNAIACGTTNPQPQCIMGGMSRPAPKIFHDTCLIDWTLTPEKIMNFVRGLSPYPAARAMLDINGREKEEYKIFKVRPVQNVPVLRIGESRILNDKIVVGCYEGNIEILELQPPGKKRMLVKDFINGIRR